MKRHIFIISIVSLLLSNLTFAQAGKLRGIVADKETGDQLIGVKITVIDIQRNATTDWNGEYTIMGIPPGVYEVQAEYIGYQKTTITNIRIHANLTTICDFQLSSADLAVHVKIVNDRPLILRTASSTVRIQTQEDIQNLPIRGLENLIALNPGAVLQDGILHIRGGRSREVAYTIDGATNTNPLFNDQNASVIQEAIAELQLYTGGFPAEIGGANSAVVNATLRTGGPGFNGSVDYQTDDFVDGGNTFLGTTSRGYHNVVATLGGSFPWTSRRLRFFMAGQMNDARNRSSVFIEPFSFNPIDFPWFVEDGFRGRSNFKGKPLTDASGETIPLIFERNFLPDNTTRSFSGNGTLVFDLSKQIRLLLTGSVSHTQEREGRSNFYAALKNYYSDTEDVSTVDQNHVSLRATHVIHPTTYYDVILYWNNSRYKNFDARFGDDWMKYTDRRVWEEARLNTSDWRGVFEGPLSYSAVLDFNFTPPNAPKNSYSKNSQSGLGGSFDFVTRLKNRLEFKAGGRFESWTMRTWSIANIRNYMNYLYGSTAEKWPEGKTFSSDYEKRIYLTKQGSIQYYGWDYDGTTKIDDGAYGPRKPVFASAYVQTLLEHRNLILNLGLRWEHFDYNQPRPRDVEIIPGEGYGAAKEWVDVESLVETAPYDYLLPRISLALPVSESTVFHAQYGEYAQTVSLNRIFQTVYALRSVLPENRSVFGAQVWFLAQPERTTQYEFGLRQTLSPNFALTLTAFYKDLKNQLRRGPIYADGKGRLEEGQRFIGGLLNDDVGTVKGIELTLDLRRTKRMAARVGYTLSDARGTGSDIDANNVVMSDVIAARYPTVLYPLDYSQTHRGSIMLDYRFPKGDGGFLFEGVGCNLLLTFNSGHPYTKIAEPQRLGCADPWTVGVRMLADNRFRNPTEPVNRSTTPWVANLDLAFEKVIYLGQVNVKVYTTILNVLNTKHIVNVYPATGTDHDDGWLKSLLGKRYSTVIPGYRTFYEQINLVNGWAYNWATGASLWGAPRQIRFGLMIEF